MNKKILLLTLMAVFSQACGEVPLTDSGYELSEQTIDDAGDAKAIFPTTTTGTGVYSFCKQWIQEAYLKASNVDGDDSFGVSVSMSGNRIVVGANHESSNQTTVTNGSTASANNSIDGAGAAYVYSLNAGVWTQEAYLKASNANAYDSFGYSTALSGTKIVVSALNEDSDQTTVSNGSSASANNNATESGAAYVFEKIGLVWQQTAYLKASNANSNDWFGESVSISDNRIVVGATLEDSSQTTITNGSTSSLNNSMEDAGAAYVYEKIGGLWQQTAYLKASNAHETNAFGRSVSISGTRIVVGSDQEDSNQSFITNGSTSSLNNSFINAGAAYVYSKNGSIWVQEAYLKPSNINTGDAFGSSVALSGNRIVVGAPYEDSNQTTITNGAASSADNSLEGSGAAYVFEKIGLVWQQTAYLKASNTDMYDFFGQSVAISGNRILVGVSAEDSNQATITTGTNSSSDNSADGAGATYVYVKNGTTWIQEAYIKASNANAGDAFGSSVALSGNRIVVGAPGEQSNQNFITNGATSSADNSNLYSAGAAYVYLCKDGTVKPITDAQVLPGPVVGPTP